METLLRIGLSNAAAALLLALVIVAVARVWRRPAVLHALWLLVIVKLVTPPLVWVNAPWLTAPESSPPAAAPSADLAPVESSPDWGSAVVTAEPAVARPVVETGAGTTVGGGRQPPDSACFQRPQEASGGLRPPLAPDIAPLPVPYWTVATFAAWVAGSLAWYALAVVRLWRFRRLLRHATPAPESLRQRAGRLADKMGLRRRPGVWLVPGRVAPMLWAAGGRPRVLFPAELLGLVDADQQNALLVHELAHLRRRDHWVRWLEFAAAGLYWWDPVLWFARRELREAEEQCCDAWVTTTLPGAGKTYAAALLETLDFLSDPPPAAPLLASGIGRVSDLKRRLTMIMRGTTPKSLGWRGVLAVLGAGALLLPLLPAWARGQTPAKAEDAKPESGAAARDTLRFFLAAPRSPEESAKDRAELQALEAGLAQKQAEAADLAAKIQALKARLYGEAAKTPPGDGAPKGLVVVAVEAKDAGPDQLKQLLEKLRALQAAATPPGVIVLDKVSGKILMKSGEDPNLAPGDPAFIARMTGQPTQWVFTAAGPTAFPTAPPGVAVTVPATPPAPNADRRIDELENKLKGILDEVEHLRRERKDDPGSDKDAKPLHSYGPAPMGNLPLIGGLFKTAPAPTADAGHDLNTLRAARDKELAERATLAAERDNALSRATVAAKEWDALVAAARGEAQRAEAARKEAEVQLAKAQAKDPKGDDSHVAEAELNVRRAQLEKAKIELDRQADQNRKQHELLLQEAAAYEARLKECEVDLNRLDKQLSQLKEAQGADAPGKP